MMKIWLLILPFLMPFTDHVDRFASSFQGESSPSHTVHHNKASVQCSGMTKSGSRCRNRTNNASGYCYLHEKKINAGSSLVSQIGAPVQPAQTGQRLQCSGTTRAGNRCKRMTTNASGRCYQHDSH